MNHEETELQIWEYIDGTCTAVERERISVLISTDAAWKQTYEVLAALHAAMATEPEQPSLRFTKNVMESLAGIKIAHTAGSYINKYIVRSIAALFIIVITGTLVYAFANTKWQNSESHRFSLNVSDVFSSAWFSIFFIVNIILALALLDSALRRKQQRHPHK